MGPSRKEWWNVSDTDCSIEELKTALEYTIATDLLPLSWVSFRLLCLFNDVSNEWADEEEEDAWLIMESDEKVLTHAAMVCAEIVCHEIVE